MVQLSAGEQMLTPTPVTAETKIDSGKVGIPSDFVSGLINLEFSDYHLTPRGINLQDKGLVSQPKLVLYWKMYGSTKGPIDEVDLTTGIWNDVDTVQSGVKPGNWNEVDPILGFNVKFLRDWLLEVPFTAFISETSSYATCWNVDPKLTYHDHFLTWMTFNPYVEVFDELTNKSTVVLNAATAQSGYYAALGCDPTYKFADLPLKLELPSYLTLPSDKFYQRADGSGGGTGLGLVSTMLKATVPLEFMPKTVGDWSVYAGVQYMYLNNPGLLDGNAIVGAATSRNRDLEVFHGGLTVSF